MKNTEQPGLFLIIFGFVTILCLLTHGLVSFGQDNRSFLNTPQIIQDPSSREYYSPERRKFTGIPSLAISQGGRMWAVWYAGETPAEDLNNYVLVATSGDNGKTWKEMLAIDPDGPGPVRTFDPEAWIAPDGQLWIFWAQNQRIQQEQSTTERSTTCGVWAISTNSPEAEDPEWSNPRRISDGVMMCKPIVLSTGEWTLPVSFWHQWKESAAMVVSSDMGQTWQLRGSVNVPREIRNHDEHMIVERKDGSLWMLVRTKYGIGESVSFDKGFNWSPLLPSRIQHPASRFFIYRLNSGNLLLVKHGPIDMRTGRSHLMAFISKDDGHTWSNGLLLDERPGVSYPDGQQTGDGIIHIIYDYSRRRDQNVIVTNFTEDDISIGSDSKILEVFKRRQIVSKGGLLK